MKSYILRDPKTVEPQKFPRPRRGQPGPLPREATTPPGPVLHIGLDVHNDSIAVSLAPFDSHEVRRYGIIGGHHDDVLKLLQKLQAAHPGVALQCVTRRGGGTRPVQLTRIRLWNSGATPVVKQ